MSYKAQQSQSWKCVINACTGRERTGFDFIYILTATSGASRWVTLVGTLQPA